MYSLGNADVTWIENLHRLCAVGLSFPCLKMQTPTGDCVGK